MVELSEYQLAAVRKLKTGSILCGGVGSGKSRTALAYYLFKECKGDIKVIDSDFGEVIPLGHKKFSPMKAPKDLYIITTAKKRDSLEWEKECARFVLSSNRENSHSGVKVTIDSWNNIKKYKDVFGSFFIFDEQRVVGSGVWVKTFLNIARKNGWILLSATPGDQWSDYIPVFVANGFFKNKTDFTSKHCVYSRFTKYPKIERYVGEKVLKIYLDSILVIMKDNRKTIRHVKYEIVDYDRDLYKTVMKDRWDPYENCPIQETGKLLYLLRRVANSHPDRIKKVKEIVQRQSKCIVFYNFNYELDLLRDMCEEMKVRYSEWNGKVHQEIPKTKRWVYLAQYAACCEGWECRTTDTIIFYSQNYSYRMIEQASGRIDRMNTPYLQLYYYHLRSTAPIDLAIYRAISNKKNFNERAFSRKLGN